MAPRGTASAAEPRLRLAYDDARRSIDRQAAKLDELRGRASMVLGAAAIAGSLGRAGKHASSVAGLISLLAFCVVAMSTAFVLLPSKGWRFARHPRRLADSYVDGSPDVEAALRSALGHLAEDFDANEGRMGRVIVFVSVSIVALAVQVVAVLAQQLRG